MHNQTIFYTLIVGLSVLFCSASPVFANKVNLEDVHLKPLESEETILTISSSKGVKEYTLAEIEVLGLKRLHTSTFWPEDNGAYEGVLLQDLLHNVGTEKCTSLLISALDGYQVKIPCEDFEKWPVLLATRQNGKKMSIRQKGPIRIIYPLDIGGDIASSDMRSRWIWAIQSISITN